MVLIVCRTLTAPPLHLNIANFEHVSHPRIAPLTLLRTENFEFRAPLRLNHTESCGIIHRPTAHENRVNEEMLLQ